MNRRSTIFISCSSSDKELGFELCARLEHEGILCWYAPRDVCAGSQFNEQMIQAISDSDTMIVVLSANSESSPEIRREVEFAARKGIRVVFCRMDDGTTEPTPTSEFYLTAPGQVLDARANTGDFSQLVQMLRPHNISSSPPESDTSSAEFRTHAPIGPDGRGQFAESDTVIRDPVDCSVYAPTKVLLNNEILIQVYVHLPDQGDQVRKMAEEFDSETQRRGITSLGTEIRRGSTLSFQLSIPKLSIDAPAQQLTWQGKAQCIQFAALAGTETTLGTVIGRVDIAQDSIPIGTIRFKLEILDRSVSDQMQPTACGESSRYKRAFISYASSDRSEVMKRVQMLSSVGIHFFQDILDLDPGDRWARELFRHIDDSDVMFLFWSSSAKASEWVSREWKYGLEKKGDDFIRPVVIEGPPPPEPPQELAHIHFADRLMYFMKSGI